MMDCYVFDTGALIGAERRKPRALQYLRLGQRGQVDIITPVVCVLEWWRGRSDEREEILDTVVVEPVTLAVAQTAGEALASVRGGVDPKLTIDAAVAAYAASRGAVVITSDPDDFDALRAFFPTLRVLSI